MKLKNGIVLRSIGISLAFITGTIFCFPTPSIAHVVNNDSLSIQLNQVDTEVMVIESNLLSREGQRIVIDAAFTEKIIPITVNCQQMNLEKNQEVTGSFEVISSDSERLKAALDKESVIFDGTEQTINLTLQLLEEKMPNEPEREEPETEVQESKEPENETTETPEIPDDSSTGTEGIETEILSENEAEEPQDTVGVQVLEPVFTGTGEILEESEGETKAETEISETQKLEEETSAELEETEPEAECLVAEVVMTVGEQKLSAKLEIRETMQLADEASGELKFCPSQYHPSGKVKIINGEEEECILSGFPAMTKYSIDDKHYLLYSEGSIKIPAGKEVIFDFSKTGVEKDITFTTTSGKSYTLNYVELPTLTQTNSPLIVNEDGISLALTKTWGMTEPVLKIENLTVADGQTVWKTVETIIAAYNEDGKLQITPDGAEAGTYRATVSWIENEVTLYELEFPFYVQYQSGNWGGAGQ